MALREVLQFPDPRLKQVSEPIKEITDELRELAGDMCEVMYDEPGIGLAAPQVGEGVRLIVIDTDWSDEGNEKSPTVIVNPEFVEIEGKIVWEEGCLSVPDFNAEVTRSERVRVRGLDLDGNEIIEEAEGLRAVCLQHEIDHLNGVLFIDRISRLKRSMYVKRRKKQLAAEQSDDEVDISGSRF
ncbi:MAG: peptide deformylase [Deltaproteobacteria bacterium]|nr:peptide deformylase [Deltaproteobacteria bacterium]MBW2417518.1 peptide deformylase [Deltaproteobacteria bacterium]